MLSRGTQPKERRTEEKKEGKVWFANGSGVRLLARSSILPLRMERKSAPAFSRLHLVAIVVRYHARLKLRSGYLHLSISLVLSLVRVVSPFWRCTGYFSALSLRPSLRRRRVTCTDAILPLNKGHLRERLSDRVPSLSPFALWADPFYCPPFPQDN